MEYAAIREILGGNPGIPQIKNDLDLIKLKNVGITKKALLSFSNYSGISLKEMPTILPISLRTIQRHKLSDHFDASISDQLIHITEVFAKGKEVFEDKHKFLSWLSLPNRIFDNQKPIILVNSIIGREMILDELGRIEHGIVA